MKILVLSGVHGSEQSAIKVGMMLKQAYSIKTDGFGLEIKVIPFINKNALINNSREYVDCTKDDTKDLNRSMVDEMDKSFKKIKEELQFEIDTSDVVIDIHNSPDCGHFFLVDKDDFNKRNCRLLKQAGVTYASRHTKGGTIKDFANSENTVGFTYEFSGMTAKQNFENIDKAYKDIDQLIKYFIKRKHILEDSKIEYQSNELKEMHMPKTGYIEYSVKCNDIVKPGDEIFRIMNEENHAIYSEDLATKDNICIMSLGNNYEAKGSSIVMFYKVK